MSWRASGYVKGLVICPSGERLTKTEKLLALCLADSHQDKSDTYTYPAMATLAEEALMDVRSCRRLLLALERKGVIEIVRPDRQGAGQLNFYRFPALDGRAGGEREGGQPVRLFFAEKGDKRGTKGGQKADKNRTPLEPLFGEQKQEPQKPSPQPPTLRAGEGRRGTTDACAASALDPHVDAVVRGCGWNGKRRLRRAIAEQLERAQARGQPPEATVRQMVEAWDWARQNRDRVRYDCGAQRFVDEGRWRPDEAPPLDVRVMEQERQQAAANVGAWRPM